ncbi:MAG: glycosyltransferase family 1 protein [Bacteroidetes bacterium]|nr:glycosyltransferase family 1 protein [Bacteroidota bacterium]
MSYRFIRITDYYDGYLKSYYERFPGKSHLSYEEQHNHLKNDSVELTSSFGKYLRNMGVDAMEIIANAEPLQRAWAKEHNLNEYLTFQKLISEQIKYYKPDVVWVDPTKLLNKKWIQNLRNEVRSLKLIVGHICAPYNSEIADSFSSFDIMFTCAPCQQKELTDMGSTAELIYHSFDPSILESLKTETKNYPRIDFIFTGSLFTGYGLHKSRIEYIEKMLEEDINISIFGNLETRSRVLSKKGMYYAINFLKNIKCNFIINEISLLKKNINYGDEKINYYSNKLINSVKPPVFGLEMFKLLASSKICFNIHGEIAKKCAGNIRLFEATGTGTCLVTDWRENLTDLFDVEKEIVTYKSAEECMDKVKWLLNNPDEREKIAKAGQERTLKYHTVENRAAVIDKILRNSL